MEDSIREMGFESEEEFHKLVGGVDLSDPDRLRRFEHWKYSDGTKEGLIRKVYDSGMTLEQVKETARAAGEWAMDFISIQTIEGKLGKPPQVEFREKFDEWFEKRMKK